GSRAEAGWVVLGRAHGRRLRAALFGDRGLSPREPALDPDLAKAREIRAVSSHERELVDSRDRGYLTVDVRRRPARLLETCAFLGMPVCRRLVVRQDRDGSQDVVEESGDRALPLRSGEAPATEDELMPDDRCRRHLAPKPIE